MSKLVIKRTAIAIFVFVCLLYLLPIAYFMVFPATDAIQRQATQLPKGLVVEYCFNYDRLPNYGKGSFLMDLRWAAPSTFALDLRSPYFTRCGYLPWIPFIKYPFLGFIDIPGLIFKWNNFCLGNCQ
jgi:hypothetical protein